VPKAKNRYSLLLETIFREKYREGILEIDFEREELMLAAKRLKMVLPKNLGDIVYAFRYRADIPELLAKSAPAGMHWIIRPAGRGKYRLALTSAPRITPNISLAVTKIPDSTPGIVARYSIGDEQALLTKIRYNRLIDVFTGVACYSLQSHLRTTVEGIGQVETDEIYVGVDKRGAHYVFPVQAKGGSDQLGIVQIEQDIALCEQKYPGLICSAIAAQFIESNLIALFTFVVDDDGPAISDEKHYRLVAPDELTDDELRDYGNWPLSR